MINQYTLTFKQSNPYGKTLMTEDLKGLYLPHSFTISQCQLLVHHNYSMYQCNHCGLEANTVLY